MADPTKNVEMLPNEIMDKVFSQVDWQYSIRNCRLVSKQFNDTASSHLTTGIVVRMTSESLAEFEEFCDSPTLNRSRARVTIILSYYDIKLASDMAQFMENCDSVLFKSLETLERMNYCMHRSGEGTGKDPIEEQLWAVINENQLGEISKEGFDESSAKPFQKLAMRIHTLYKECCNDQEEVRKDNKHISRLCAALCKLPNLEELVFLDDPWHESEKLEESDFQDIGFGQDILEHFNASIFPSKWCGTFTTAYTTAPPFDMLGELCSQLGQCGIRPRSIRMDLNATADLRPMELTLDQRSGVSDLVSKATELRLTVDGWARKGSLAENNDRPKDEMLALCSFTRPFFSAPALEKLYICFDSYPCFSEPPNVSVSDILPIEQSWPRLANLALENQPATMDDLRAIVASLQTTLKRFEWHYGWLLTGGWDQALQVLRSFKKVRHTSIQHPRGERFGDGGSFDDDGQCEKMSRYVNRQRPWNPLGPWKPAN